MTSLPPPTQTVAATTGAPADLVRPTALCTLRGELADLIGKTNYSRRLFGLPRMPDNFTMNFVWLSLLPAATLREIASLGVCPRQGLRADGKCPTMYANHSQASTPRNSLWLYERLQTPVASGSWVEVTHCAQGPEANHGQTWAYVASGSGLSVNVGRTFTLDERDVLPLFGGQTARLNNAIKTLVSLQSRSDANACRSPSGDVRILSRALGLSNCSFDSIQRMFHRDLVNHNFHHELILVGNLSYSGGSSSSAGTPSQFHCGRYPDLFDCADSPVPALLERCSRELPFQIWSEEACFKKPASLETPPSAPMVRRIAWFHPPKTGTSFGTALVHFANSRLPPRASMPYCGPDGRLCNGTTGDFFKHYPVGQWFSTGVSLWLGSGFGSHRRVDDHVLRSFRGSLFGLFREPARRAMSAYLYQDLRSNGRLRATTHVLNYTSNVAGMVVKMLAGQEDGNDCRDMERTCHRHITPNVSEATRRLSEFQFIGLTDEFNKSLCLFHLQFGGQCLQVELQNSRPTTHSAVGQRMKNDVDLMEAVRAADPFDSELYRHAQVQFHTAVQRHKLSCETCQKIGCPC